MIDSPHPPTDKLYRRDSWCLDFRARVLSDQPAGDRREVLLDRTAFYPTGGGQAHDTGLLAGRRVLDVRNRGEQVVHLVEGAAPLGEGQEVEGRVDGDRRLDHLQQHSGQHMLSQGLIRHGGAHTVSVHLGRETSNVEVDRVLRPEDLRAAEAEVQRVIFEDREVRVHEVGPEELERFDLRRVGYQGDRIRLVEVVDFDVTTCGGTHAHRTGQVGGLCLIGAERLPEGMRVHFLAGGRVARRFRRQQEVLDALGRRLDTDLDQIEDRVHRSLEDQRAAWRQRDRWREEALRSRARHLREVAPQLEGRRLVRHIAEDLDREALETLARLVVEERDVVALLATREEDPPRLALACSEGLPDLHCGQWMRRLAEGTGVKGGGGPTLAQGVLKERDSSLDEVLAAAEACAPWREVSP